MRLPPLSPILLIAMFAATASARAAPPRYVQLVNHAHDSVVAMAVAVHGSGAFDPIPLEERLQGGGDGQTVAVRGEGCRYDLRFSFADGRVLRYEGVDLCRYGKVAVRPLPRDAGQGEYVVAWHHGADGLANAQAPANGAGEGR